jgi:NAD(P)-dependent dehydrogenase (short-subunit alcohol dehydrogenase family)
MEPSPKVVLVTGTSSGIGRLCAEHLATRGYRVFGTRRKPPTESTGPPVEPVLMDVDDDRSVADGIDAIVQKAGRLDAVVNNAGWGLMGAVEDTSTAEAKAQFETNFFGVLRVCRAVLPIMRRQGAGHIINISSLAGTVGLPFSSMYSASKFAVESLSESMRWETRRLGIRVVLVEPGDFHTNFPASRRLTKIFGDQSAYWPVLEKVRAAQERDEQHGPTPERISHLIERILRDPNPRLRYSVGMLSQRIVIPCKRFLPARFFEWMFCRVMGV